MIKLQIGFTDVANLDNLVFDESLDDDNNESTRYNIFKQSTDELATIEWKLNIEIPAVKRLIETWEYIIRVPHLAMIQKKQTTNKLLPTHADIDYFIEFINLLPLKNDFYFLSEEDFEYLQSPNRNFGDLLIMSPVGYEVAGFNYEESSEYAVTEKTLDYYNPAALPVILPRFNVDFGLNPHQRKSKRYDISVLKFIDDNKQVFEQNNYSIERFKQTYGRLVVGTLINDPEDAYDIVNKYPYICRTSITKEE